MGKQRLESILEVSHDGLSDNGELILNSLKKRAKALLQEGVESPLAALLLTQWVSGISEESRGSLALDEIWLSVNGIWMFGEDLRRRRILVESVLQGLHELHAKGRVCFEISKGIFVGSDPLMLRRLLVHVGDEPACGLPKAWLDVDGNLDMSRVEHR